MRILIVEDEEKISEVIEEALKNNNYFVDVCNDGENGLDYSLSGLYDLIILDVMLPVVDGFTILEEIKKNNIESKVIMLTAKSMLDDKLYGLRNGANDYITKPFHIAELIERVNIQLRRQERKDNVIEFYDLKLNLNNASLVCDKTGESVQIVGKELVLLEYLMNNTKRVISKEMLYDKVWGIDSEIESNNLEVYLSFVRRKLKVIGSDVLIKAIRGIGYKLEVKDEEVTK